MQKKRNSSASAKELSLFGIKPSKFNNNKWNSLLDIIVLLSTVVWQWQTPK